MNAIDEILAGYDGLQAGQEAFYKDLHAHPELSHSPRAPMVQWARPADRDGALGVRQAVQAVQKLPLTLAVEPTYPDDLARRHLQVHVPGPLLPG